MKKEIIVGVIIGVVAGIGIAIYRAVKHGGEEDQNSYAYLVKNQSVVDILDGAFVMNWFRSKSSLAKGKAYFFLARPTTETSKMFALDHVPKELDVEHCMLQCVVDEATTQSVAIRLISFSKLSEKIASQLKEKEFVILDY